MPLRHYCTYFDHRYLPRGLVLMDSLRALSPEVRFYVLALDAPCAEVLAEMADPDVVVVPLPELEAADPDLLRIKADRTLIEYYFTVTPCFPRLLMDRHIADGDLLTYIDADTWFRADPEIVFDDIGDGSIAITPHRFSSERQGLSVYGLFNVGWLSWRKDAIGLRCLEDYRAACLDWCHDRLEGQRYADQKYLDAWPARYPGLVQLAHPGINAALWNINGHEVTEVAGRLYVSGRRLVFWHFHGLKETEEGGWLTGIDDDHAARNPLLGPRLYEPYVRKLGIADRLLQMRHGLIRETKAHIRYDASPPASGSAPAAPAPPPSAGDPQYRKVSRAEAEALTNEAWLHPDVAAAQADAFDALIAEMAQGRPRRDLQVAAAAVAATGLTAPSLLEVGCGSGYYSAVFDALLPQGVAYSGVDYSPAMIALARQRYPDRDFSVGDATALPFPDRSVDIVFNGVSLMHTLDVEAAIREARRVARKVVIFHTAILVAGVPTTYLTKSAYGRPTAEVIVSEGAFRALLARYGMTILGALDSIPYDPGVLGRPTQSRTFICGLLDDEADTPTAAAPAPRPLMLNLGCGSHFHPAWVNVDMASAHPAVMAYNLLEGFPFEDGVFDLVYHSHVLEHMPRWEAPRFLAECWRVLKPGGLLRVAIPDLETICRLYLAALDRLADVSPGREDPDTVGRYDWMMMELLDQMVRIDSGGEMARHWMQQPVPAEDFVVSRVGPGLRDHFDALRAQDPPPVLPPHPAPDPERIGRFRLGGEVHQWMYDRWSLRRLMTEAGFKAPRQVAATESALPGFAAFGLDSEADGAPRKPDSLFMEARKP